MSKVDSARLVFHIDIFILSAAAFFVLLNAPRIVARLTRSSEFGHGIILRSTNNEPPQPRQSLDSDDSRTVHSQAQVAQGVSEKGSTTSYPPHVPEWTSYLPQSVVLIRYPLSPRLSLGQALLLLLYSALLLYAGLYKSSPFTHPTRAGWVAISQIPVVYLLATKNNVLGTLVGYGYEKLNFFHQFAGVLLVLAANVHAIGQIYKFTLAGVWTARVQETYIRWGLVALVSLDILFFFSTSIWRQKAYNVFFTSHTAAFIVFLVAVPLHQSVAIPYVAIAAGLYGLDLVFRAVKSRVYVASVRPISELGVTRVDVPQVNAGWRAGQHVRVRFLSGRMGWFGWTEMHPYTIASASKGPEGLVLMCKKAGGWSGTLYDLASESDLNGEGGGRRVRIMIEGPYGGTGHCIPASFSGAMLVAGGSGITFPLAIAQDLLRRGTEGTSRVQALHLVWVIKNYACLTPLIPLFSSLLQQQSTLSSFRISVFYTGVGADSAEPPKMFLPSGLTLTPGHPNLGEMLQTIIDFTLETKSASTASAKSGILVGVCGPVALGQTVCRIAREVDTRKRRAVGGVEVHEEIFSW